jgi:hypothetical protein
MTTRSNRSDSGYRPKAGEVVGTRSFGFFWIVCQKKLVVQAKRRRKPFIREANTNKRL